jgi:hypothetical protein
LSWNYDTYDNIYFFVRNNKIIKRETTIYFICVVKNVEVYCFRTEIPDFFFWFLVFKKQLIDQSSMKMIELSCSKATLMCMANNGKFLFLDIIIHRRLYLENFVWIIVWYIYSGTIVGRTTNVFTDYCSVDWGSSVFVPIQVFSKLVNNFHNQFSFSVFLFIFIFVFLFCLLYKDEFKKAINHIFYYLFKIYIFMHIHKFIVLYINVLFGKKNKQIHKDVRRNKQECQRKWEYQKWFLKCFSYNAFWYLELRRVH